MEIYKILIADDHQVVINGLTQMLSDEPGISLISPVLKIEDILPSLHLHKISVLILDVNMNESNTLKIVPQIRESFPELKVITFTSYDTPSIRKEAARLGINAFLTKNVSKEKLLQTIFKVLNIKSKDSIHLNINDDNIKEVNDKFLISKVLSDRELEILKLVAQGNTSQQIAKAILLSKHTVHWHRKNIIAKLGLNSASEMVKFAHENGLV